MTWQPPTSGRKTGPKSMRTASGRPLELPRRRAARLAALSLMLTVGVAIGAEPGEWLERMNRALTTRNYIGVFTHNHGGRVETLRIIHRARGGGGSEQIGRAH